MNNCPYCGSIAERFIAGDERIEVIHCKKGCMHKHMKFPVAIRSIDVKGYDDLVDAWNTGVLIIEKDGRPNVQFNAFGPKHIVEVVPTGPYNNWSPEISKQKREDVAQREYNQ